jgi:CheY-like chemotaxis protein/anti-sigma regulatory factor (Ser/Thr protein kinase)
VPSRSLLLVDSDPAIHELLGDVLKGDDRRIDDAFDGQEALERLRTAPCDLVVAGQGRNGLDGLKLLRRLSAIRPETRVIVTGEPNPALVVGAIRQHAYSYFHKPLAAGPVADMVQQALTAERWRDDIRVLSARPEWVTLEVRCKLETADRTIHFLRELESDLEPHTRDDVAAAFRELLMNAIEHGGKSDPRKRVRVSLLRTPRSLIVHVADPGSGFSLDMLPHAAISNPDDEPTRHVEVRAEEGRRPGGFGILMTRNLVDELLYNERGNAALFVKYLQ